MSCSVHQPGDHQSIQPYTQDFTRHFTACLPQILLHRSINFGFTLLLLLLIHFKVFKNFKHAQYFHPHFKYPGMDPSSVFCYLELCYSMGVTLPGNLGAVNLKLVVGYNPPQLFGCVAWGFYGRFRENSITTQHVFPRVSIYQMLDANWKTSFFYNTWPLLSVICHKEEAGTSFYSNFWLVKNSLCSRSR